MCQAHTARLPHNLALNSKKPQMKFIIIILLSLNTIIGYAGDIKNCSPKILYYGDSFTIDLNTPHGSDFIITPPNRKKRLKSVFGIQKAVKISLNQCLNTMNARM